MSDNGIRKNTASGISKMQANKPLLDAMLNIIMAGSPSQTESLSKFQACVTMRSMMGFRVQDGGLTGVA